MFNFKYIWIHKKAIFTLIIIHGYGSSHLFAKNLFNKNLNFNIIVLNLPGSIYNPTDKKLSLNLFTNYVNQFLDKRVKTKKNILLGHSLGGIVASFFASHKKIMKVIQLSPLHPFIEDSKWFKALKLMHSSETKNTWRGKITKKTLFNIAKRKKPNSLKFIVDNPWLPLMLDIIINDKKMQEVHELFKDNKDKFTFISGNKDKIIEMHLLEKFTKSLNKSTFFISDAQHNPLEDKSSEVLRILNDCIEFKKRYFFRYLTVKKGERIFYSEKKSDLTSD